MQGKDYYKALLLKYKERTISKEEEADLFEELDRGEDAEGWEELIAEISLSAPPEGVYDAARWEAVWRQVRPRGTVRLLVRLAAAAILVVCVSIGLYYYLHNSSHPGAPEATLQPISPGGKHATLTLSGGKQIILDSAASGTLATQGGALVQKRGAGELAYLPTAGAAGLINTLATPRGGEYQLTLPDGSRVWLNSASSITYPTAFTGTSRVVSITGEAYLEVSSMAGHPFMVRTDSATLEVLGTNFDINAYTDEPSMKTTLATGRVRVRYGVATRVMEPGEQVRMHEGKLVLVDHADVEQALAWKNGMVKLTGAGVEEVMRQVSRWYDVDVVYASGVPKATFVGEVSRTYPLTTLLKAIEAGGGVHFELNGKTIIVKP